MALSIADSRAKRAFAPNCLASSNLNFLLIKFSNLFKSKKELISNGTFRSLITFIFQSMFLKYEGVSYLPFDFPDGDDAPHSFTITSIVSSFLESFIFFAQIELTII